MPHGSGEDEVRSGNALGSLTPSETASFLRFPLPDASLRGPLALAIGNFDGVHLGHQSALEQLRSRAEKAAIRSAVLTFDPHPAAVVGRGAPPILTTLERKATILSSFGVDQVYVRTFDLAFSMLSPQAFVDDLLIVLGVRLVLVGDNFRFGYRREGDASLLRKLGRSSAFDVETLSLVRTEEGVISSSRIREALAAGDLARANAWLGRPHRVSGLVVEGRKLGRTLGFPTANLSAMPEMIPMAGVYAARVTGLGEAVVNIGRRPTVEAEGALAVEAHILDFSADLYGQVVTVDLIERIRDEQRFDGVEALRAQIGRDVERARYLLSM